MRLVDMIGRCLPAVFSFSKEDITSLVKAI
jgi:hypothetical protein